MEYEQPLTEVERWQLIIFLRQQVDLRIAANRLDRSYEAVTTAAAEISKQGHLDPILVLLSEDSEKWDKIDLEETIWPFPFDKSSDEIEEEAIEAQEIATLTDLFRIES